MGDYQRATPGIPLDQCIDRRLYRIRARNLKFGVYNASQREFIGIRTKFGSRFLDAEFHWDLGPPYGTCTPVELLPDELAAHILAGEYLPVSEKVAKHTPNDELFAFLEEIERRYPDWEGGWP